MLAVYARARVESAALASRRARERIDRVTIDDASRAHLAAAGPGPVMVTAHLGSWDLAAAWLAANGHPLTVFAEPVEPSALFERECEVRARNGVAVVAASGSAGWRRARAELAAGRGVGFVADRPGDGATVEVRTPGGTARLPSGPYRLALAAGVPVVPVVAIRTATGYGVRVSAPIRGTAVAAMAQAFADVLAGWAGSAPDEWVMLSPGPPAKNNP